MNSGPCRTPGGHELTRLRRFGLRRSRCWDAPELEAKVLFEHLAAGREDDAFLIGVLESANALRSARVSEELAVMSETAVSDLPDYRELMVVVGNNSTIRLHKDLYSVPSRLIGAKLLARIYENRVVLLTGADEVAQLPLGRSDRGAVIDYRHLIGHHCASPEPLPVTVGSRSSSLRRYTGVSTIIWSVVLRAKRTGATSKSSK